MSKSWWDGLYSRCCDIIERPGDFVDSCRGKVLASLFFEPSTRTNFSFQAACMRLGGSVFGFSNPLETSVSKGETLADTIRVASCYADTVVIRSPLEGAATAAALYSEVPVINAGDGGHFHPTQTLADLTTIARYRGGIGGFCIGLCGDLKYGRTVHSLIMALSHFFEISFCLISPPELRAPQYMLDFMREHGQQYIEVERLDECLGMLDILYMTRVQSERFTDKSEYENVRGVYVLTKSLLDGAKRDMIVMHPLPRDGEIAPEVDADSRAVYFEQARNGMFIRMALLLEFLHAPRQMPGLTPAGGLFECVNEVCVTRKERYLPPLRSSGGDDRCGYCDKNIVY